MNKYFVLFSVPAATMADWAKTVSPEERKKQSDQMMKDWGAWQKKHAAHIKDNGMPLGKTKRVTKGGKVADIKNDLNYYIIIEAESHDAAAEVIKDNPHFMIPDSYVDVMEIPHMGM
jgi:hypothetical protein